MASQTHKRVAEGWQKQGEPEEKRTAADGYK